MRTQPKLVAIVGGSGAGKSWLAHQLERTLEIPVTLLSLDDFYRDQSHLPPGRRKLVNFDHPRAIDWRLVEAALQDCRAGRSFKVPCYDFTTHARLEKFRVLAPRQIVIVDGLWLLWRPRFRRMFDLRIHVHCPAHLRLQRRMDRDLTGRGRDSDSVRRQFRQTVAPMHKLFVAPQARWADVVLRQPVDESKVVRIGAMIQRIANPASPASGDRSELVAASGPSAIPRPFLPQEYGANDQGL